MDYKQLLRYFLAGKARLPPPRQQQVRFSAAKLRKKSFTTPFVMSILQRRNNVTFQKNAAALPSGHLARPVRTAHTGKGVTGNQATETVLCRYFP